MRLSQIAVDPKLMEEGEWYDHPYFDGVKVRVRSMRSEAYRKRRASLMNRLPMRRRKSGDAIEAQEKIDREASADLLTGWQGIEDESGNEVDFTLDQAREMARDIQFYRFFEGVVELASEIGQDETDILEESRGN